MKINRGTIIEATIIHQEITFNAIKIKQEITIKAFKINQEIITVLNIRIMLYLSMAIQGKVYPK